MAVQQPNQAKNQPQDPNIKQQQYKLDEQDMSFHAGRIGDQRHRSRKNQLADWRIKRRETCKVDSRENRVIAFGSCSKRVQLPKLAFDIRCSIKDLLGGVVVRRDPGGEHFAVPHITVIVNLKNRARKQRRQPSAQRDSDNQHRQSTARVAISC